MQTVKENKDRPESGASAMATPPLGGRGAIQIIDYRAEHGYYFEKLNKAWIEKYFWLEERDKWVLENPHEAILSKGGAILMATYDGVVAGTVALKKVNAHVFEFTKMVVDERFRRRGIAEALSYAAFDKARSLGATKVILYSNRILTPAITMYHKLGFTEVPIEKDIVYQRSDIKMEISIEPQTHDDTVKHSSLSL